MSPDAAGAYSGVDNLEVMEQALNYNAFLQELVTAWARPSDEILDFGAGTGVLAVPLAAAGYQVRCVEPDAGLRARLQASGLDAHVAIEEISPDSLDLVYTVNVLEHIADDLAAVAALRRRLKPGGLLVAYVPAFPTLHTSMDAKVGHLRRYRRAGLAEVLHRAGLIVEQIAYQDGLGFVATLLFKWFGNDKGAINLQALIAYDRCAFPLSRRLDRLTGRWFGKNLLAVARRHD
jgi:SAM-dependent methyltransferase